MILFPFVMLVTASWHGWHATFQQMQKIIPRLNDPESHGGDATDSFDVIVPSLAGYGFSDRPKEKGMTVFRIGDLFAKLMAELGYGRYAVWASDLDAGIAPQLALAYPNTPIGLHLSGTNPYISDMPQDLSKQKRNSSLKSRVSVCKNLLMRWCNQPSHKPCPMA